MNKIVNIQNLCKVLVLMMTISFASCSSDDDNDTSGVSTTPLPTSAVTTYTGTLAYEPASGSDIVDLNGTATISQNGSSYTITFNSSVPTISGFKFISANGAYSSIGTDGSLEGVAIDAAGDLAVDITKDGNKWGFSSN